MKANYTNLLKTVDFYLEYVIEQYTLVGKNSIFIQLTWKSVLEQ